jgi:nucleotide-binding universal stress UspA family protein
MRRILVPLDGSEFAQSIIPDARRYAGSSGTLVLVRDVPVLSNAFVGFDSRAAAYAEEAGVEIARHYLERQAESLRHQGVDVEVATYSGIAASAIDESADDFHVDLIALATHARHGLGRMIWGSVGWQALVHSPVPVLFRHEGHRGPPTLPKLLVPVDGSELAERALSITRDLMAEWQGTLYVVQVIRRNDASAEEVDRAGSYLDRVASDIRGNVHTAILRGDVVDAIAKVAEEWSITDVITTSHGRTGLSRVILGSVADGLIRRLSVPVLVVPALAARLEKEREMQSRVLQFTR